MRRRAFTGPVEGAAAASSQAVRALPGIAAEGSVQKEEQDFPLVIASVPATGQHRMVAAGTHRHAPGRCGGCYRTVRKHTGGPS